MIDNKQAFDLRTTYLLFAHHFNNPVAQEMIRDHYYLKFGVNLKLSPEVLEDHVLAMDESCLVELFGDQAHMVLDVIRSKVNQ